MNQKPVVVLLMDRYFATIHKAISDYAVQAGWMLDATMAVASERYGTPQADAIIAVYTITKNTRDWLRRHEKTPLNARLNGVSCAWRDSNPQPSDP